MAVWLEAESALKSIFNENSLLKSLAQLREGAFETAVTLMPNLVFPALSPVVATADRALTLLLPPPKAVGSPLPGPLMKTPAGPLPPWQNNSCRTCWQTNWPS